MMCADDAAQTLVRLAQQIDPESAWAQATFQEVPQTQEILGIDEDLRMRAPDLSALKQFKDGMRQFLAKARTVQETLKATEKQHVFRPPYQVDASFAGTLKATFTWCRDPRVRLLYFCRAAGFHVAGDQITLEPPVPNAVESVRRCGTPVNLLLSMYSKKLKQRLVLLNGSRNIHTYDPPEHSHTHVRCEHNQPGAGPPAHAPARTRIPPTRPQRAAR